VAPSPGSVPTQGVVDFAPTFDRVGPVGRTVRDAALLHEVAADRADLLPAVAEGAGGRLDGRWVGVVVPMSGHRNATGVRTRFEEARTAFQDLGATVVPVSVPRFGDLLDVYLTLTCVEALPVLEEHEARGTLGPEAASRLRHGRALVGTREQEDAQLVRAQIRADLATALRQCEVLVSPTVPLTAPLLGHPGMADPLARPRTDWWTVEANLAGVPAATVPAGLADGLPVGVQLMGPEGGDARLYRVAAALESALGPTPGPPGAWAESGPGRRSSRAPATA
jgi:aspartyl-tRNA(Asn)/glutamyl-tRNA(Gln) amidotransferase subunit A